MLSKIRLVFWLFVIVLVAYFVAMNNSIVTINLLPGYQTVPIPLSVVIVLSLAIGAIAALIFTIGDWIRFKVEKSRLLKQLQNCLDEKSLLEEKINTDSKKQELKTNMDQSNI